MLHSFIHEVEDLVKALIILLKRGLIVILTQPCTVLFEVDLPSKSLTGEDCLRPIFSLKFVLEKFFFLVALCVNRLSKFLIHKVCLLLQSDLKHI